MVGRLLLVITGLIFQYLFTYTFANTTVVTIPDDAEFKAKCEEVLRVEGITNPTDQENRFARRIVHLEEVANRELHRAINAEKEKDIAQEIEIKFIPRSLVDKVQDRLIGEYDAEMESYRKQMKELDDGLKKRNVEISILKGQLKASKLSVDAKKALEERIEELESTLKTETEKARKEIHSLRAKLPPALKKNTRAGRILSRKHFWQWVMEERRNNRDVKKIWKQAQKNYARKPENFQAETTIEEYIENICEGFAEVHEEVSVKTAHVLLKFEMPEGYEFDYLPIYKDETIDESMLILVNAIGLSIIRPKPDGTFNRSVTGITIPESVTRKA